MGKLPRQPLAVGWSESGRSGRVIVFAQTMFTGEITTQEMRAPNNQQMPLWDSLISRAERILGPGGTQLVVKIN